SSSTISWKLREYRKSPTRTLAALPKTALAVLRPRRRSDSSTTSSWSRVEVWMNSTTAASWWASGPRWPRARAASSSSMGRRRLPPPATMCSATWLTSTTSDASRRRIRASTAAMSSAAKAWTSGSVRAGLAGAAWGLESMSVRARGAGNYTVRARHGGRRPGPASTPDGPDAVDILDLCLRQSRRRAQGTQAHGPWHQQGHPRRQPRQRPRREVLPERQRDHHDQRGHHRGVEGQADRPD